MIKSSLRFSEIVVSLQIQAGLDLSDSRDYIAIFIIVVFVFPDYILLTIENHENKTSTETAINLAQFSPLGLDLRDSAVQFSTSDYLEDQVNGKFPKPGPVSKFDWSVGRPGLVQFFNFVKRWRETSGQYGRERIGAKRAITSKRRSHWARRAGDMRTALTRTSADHAVTPPHSRC
ncbi:hypothetical protein RRG08_030022 [Elysia crispata]|uniref:Uncharacterized protein n=1 Tax=Elysia crispata TaxID=231223 RepID=A0AAE1CPV9_9GAST|nr:hypothetical protein RRG08_030022 [Elysia crispata]